MRIVPTFVSETSDEGVWSIQLDGYSQSEFEKFFDSVNDPEWLYNFFETNNEDLTSGYWKEMSIEDAVLATIDEAAIHGRYALPICPKRICRYRNFIATSVQPLNNHEYAVAVHQKSKAKIRRGWLRLYGLRLSSNCFLITGGGIKLTKGMRRPHLETN